jgi:hypothetical protein
VALALGGLAAVPPADASPYSDAVLEHSVYYWRLGESGAFSLDQNLGVGSGAYFGAQVAKGEPGAIAGDADGSVRLYGAVADDAWASHLVIGSDAYVAAPGRWEFGWEIWIKPASLDGNTRRIVSAENAAGGYLLGARADALVFSRYTRSAGGAAWNTLSAPAPAVGAWTHVVALYDGARMSLYVNGRPAASRPSTMHLPSWGEQPPWSGGDVVRLGAHSHRWLEWDGWLDEAAFYGGTPLTPGVIAEHYAIATPTR